MNKSRSELSDIDLVIFEILVAWIEENKTDQTPMPYAELAKLVNNPSVIPTNLGTYLGRISTYCLDNNAPAISAVVGGSDTCEPGAGFFELIGRGDTKPEKRLEVWLPILNQAYEYDGWRELLAKAGAENGS